MGVGWALLLDAGSFAIAALMTAAMSAPRRRGGPRFNGRSGPSNAVICYGAEGRVCGRSSSAVAVLVVHRNRIFQPPVEPYASAPANVRQSDEGDACLVSRRSRVFTGSRIIVGALGIGVLEKTLRLLSSVVVGLLLLGTGTAFLSHSTRIVGPMAMMFLIGLGAAWTNIPIGTRVSVAVPDYFLLACKLHFRVHFRRVSADRITAGGALVAWFGVAVIMTWMGILMLIAVPALVRMPGFTSCSEASPSELTDHFLNAYPRVFGRGVA